MSEVKDNNLYDLSDNSSDDEVDLQEQLNNLIKENLRLLSKIEYLKKYAEIGYQYIKQKTCDCDDDICICIQSRLNMGKL